MAEVELVNPERTTTTESDRVRVAVVAAQPVIRAGIRHLLEAEPGLTVVGEAHSIDEALRVVTEMRPNVTVLDPDGETIGLSAVARLSGLGHGTVLVFTAAAESAVHSRAVAWGAMGVVQKHHSGRTLRRAIECVHAGEIWLDRQTTATLLRGLRRGSDADPEDAKIRSLTKRELEVIALVGIGLKNDAIAVRLSISQATVRNHLTSILGKLDLADRFELAFYAAGHGLVEDQDGRRGLRVPRSIHGQPASGIRTLTGASASLPTEMAADFSRRRASRRRDA